MKIVIIYAVSWIGMVVLAILNGAIREKFYGQFMRELSAHQLSTFMVIIFFGIYIWILTGVWQIASLKQAVGIGILWCMMTLVFEFVFGHYIMGYPWSILIRDYNIFKGRVWVFVLIWTTVAPCIFYRVRS